MKLVQPTRNLELTNLISRSGSSWFLTSTELDFGFSAPHSETPEVVSERLATTTSKCNSRPETFEPQRVALPIGVGRVTRKSLVQAGRKFIGRSNEVTL